LFWTPLCPTSQLVFSSSFLISSRHVISPQNLPLTWWKELFPGELLTSMYNCIKLRLYILAISVSITSIRGKRIFSLFQHFFNPYFDYRSNEWLHSVCILFQTASDGDGCVAFEAGRSGRSRSSSGFPLKGRHFSQLMALYSSPFYSHHRTVFLMCAWSMFPALSTTAHNCLLLLRFGFIFFLYILTDF
jgi:hypothetical protein